MAAHSKSIANITLGNCTLSRDLYGILLQRLNIPNPVNEGDQERQTGFQNPMELSESLDDIDGSLRDEKHDLYSFGKSEGTSLQLCIVH
jgi:hypothetical protein